LIAIDTNVLVRILVDDPGQPAQVDAARALASEAKQVFVPLIVQVEMVWVLESGYGLPREAVIQSLEHLEVNQAFLLENEELCHRALALFRSSNVDYSDCVILSNCRTRNLKLYTFDKRLGKLADAAPVSSIMGGK
jgi:predicted nucleic-acid-binding protein